MLYLWQHTWQHHASRSKQDNAIPLTAHMAMLCHWKHKGQCYTSNTHTVLCTFTSGNTKQCYTSGKIQKKYITPSSTEPQAYCLCLIVICIVCLFDWWARRGMCVCKRSCWTQFLSLKYVFRRHILSSCQMFWCNIYHVLWWVRKQISKYKLKIVVLHHIVTHTYMYNMNIYIVHPPPHSRETTLTLTNVAVTELYDIINQTGTGTFTASAPPQARWVDDVAKVDGGWNVSCTQACTNHDQEHYLGFFWSHCTYKVCFCHTVPTRSVSVTLYLQGLFLSHCTYKVCFCHTVLTRSVSVALYLRGLFLSHCTYKVCFCHTVPMRYILVTLWLRSILDTLCLWVQGLFLSHCDYKVYSYKVYSCQTVAMRSILVKLCLQDLFLTYCAYVYKVYEVNSHHAAPTSTRSVLVTLCLWGIWKQQRERETGGWRAGVNWPKRRMTTYWSPRANAFSSLPTDLQTHNDHWFWTTQSISWSESHSLFHGLNHTVYFMVWTTQSISWSESHSLFHGLNHTVYFMVWITVYFMVWITQFI